MAQPTEARDGIADRVKERLSIRRVGEDLLPRVAAAGNMGDGAWILDAQGTDLPEFIA